MRQLDIKLGEFQLAAGNFHGVFEAIFLLG